MLVFDLGGGTFDVTVMNVAADGAMRVLATGGDRKLGGMDFDELVLGKMQAAARAGGLDIETEAWARQDAYGKAEELKKELSFAEIASASLTGSGRPLQFDMTRAEFGRLLREKLTAVEDTTLYTLELAGLEPSSLQTVLMVGGSSRIPAFQEMLERVTGRTPVFSRNLDEDVARGAAILAAKEGGELDPRSRLAMLPPPVDVASHGLGVTVLDEETRQMINSIIIEAQNPVPAHGERTYYTVDEGQTAVEVKLNEGDEEDLEFVRQIATGTGHFGRAVPREHPVKIKIDFARDGTIVLNAYDGLSDSFLCELKVDRPGNLTTAERKNARAELARMEVR